LVVSASINPNAKRFMLWGVAWLGMTFLLVALSTKYGDIALSVALGIGFTALLVTGRRMGWF